MIIIVILFIAEFFLILLAPHEDESDRGFSLCTHKMFENVHNCNRSTWCTFKVVSKNYICYNAIIFNGFKNWILRKSPTPWSDYLYSVQQPELPPEILEYYQQTPNIKEEMQTLLEKNIELENKKHETSKNN